jgi:hypothetical protein
MEVSGQYHAPTALTLGKWPRYTLDSLGRLQSRSGRREEKKNHLPLPGIDRRSLGLTAGGLVAIPTELSQLRYGLSFRVNFMLCLLPILHVG